MDTDNARWAMDALRAATEAQTTAPYAQADRQSTTPTANSNSDSPPTTPFVSQFRIDGQPILPPLMTEEKRRQMQELRKQAIALEIRGYGMAKASRSATTLDDKAWATSDTDSNMTSKVSKISSNNSFGSQKSNCSASSQDIMIEIPRRSKLQQTKTYIYDSTQQPQLAQQLLEPPQRSRPQTLSIGSNHVLVPTICVNPPTPLCENKQSPKPPPCPDLCPTVESLCHRKLTVARRKLNNITNRIMLFEQTGNNDQLCDEPVELLWQNQEIHKPLVDKRMIQRSSTSPALHAGQTSEDQQMQRSRSFTLEQPSQALVEHMQRVANETSTSTDTSTPTPSISLNRAPSLSSIPTSSPPPLPPLPAQAVVEASAMTGSPRCHFALPVSPSCSSDQSLQHLRRDTIESKAKQVHRSSSGQSVELCKSVTTSGRRSGGHTPGRLQQQQQQIKELLERALHETKDVMEEQNVEKRRQLAVAKQKMLKDIKSAHRDRFQQLVQYQHEEQRRMQAEFDRQQKLLIEQICADINVSAYAHDQMIAAGGEVIPNGKSEYTSTDDLPSLLEVSVARSADLQSEEELQVNESAGSTARKRLFDEKGEHDGFHDVSMESLASSSSPRNRVRKPVVRSQTKPTAANRLNRSQTSASSNSPPVRRVANSNKFASSPSKSNPKSNVVSKPRRSISPSRQMALPEAMDLQQQRRNDAATILTAATRGFLVRRLFRTEQVQRIVQTIRDTLIFVLNLHLETFGNGMGQQQQQEEAANIRLKARLLQQLCSASRTLHLIFFQTSIKERMEIIARDRKRIKTKMLAMHVKQR